MIKIYTLSILLFCNSAFAVDWNKTCDIASRYIAPYYSINYDWSVALYSETNPGSKERLIRIEIQNEIYEKLIDDISNQLKSLNATDRFVVIAIYKSGFANMDLMAAQDAMPNKRIKQSKDRIERKLFEDCVRGK